MYYLKGMAYNNNMKQILLSITSKFLQEFPKKMGRGPRGQPHFGCGMVAPIGGHAGSGVSMGSLWGQHRVGTW